jgi:hypothetical protein
VDSGVAIVGLQFFGEISSSQSLCAFLSSGSILIIRDLDITALSKLKENQLSLIPPFLKQSKLVSLRVKEIYDFTSAVITNIVDEEMKVIMMTEKEDLLLYVIPFSVIETTGSEKEELVGSVFPCFKDEKVRDCRVVPTNDVSCLFVITDSGKLFVVHLSSCDNLGNFPYSVVLVDNSCKFILSATSLTIPEEISTNSVFQIIIRNETLDGKTLDYFFTVSTSDSSVLIIPHGFEEDNLKILPFQNSLSTVNSSFLLGLKDNELFFYRFSQIANNFSKSFIKVDAQNLMMISDLQTNCSFEMLLSCLFSFLIPVDTDSFDIEKFHAFLEYSLKRRFPSEIILSFGLLLDVYSRKLSEIEFYECFTKCKVISNTTLLLFF